MRKLLESRGRDAEREDPLRPGPGGPGPMGTGAPLTWGLYEVRDRLFESPFFVFIEKIRKRKRSPNVSGPSK